MNKCPLNNPDCAFHTKVAHSAACGTSGSNKCQDSLHWKTCWTEDERRQMVRTVENYLGR